MRWRIEYVTELLPAVVLIVMIVVGLPLANWYRVKADDRYATATFDKFQRNTIACIKIGGSAVRQDCYLGGKKIPLDAAFELYQLSLALNNPKTESL